MTANELAAISGIVLSLILSYVPGLNTNFAALPSVTKKLIMLGLLVLVAAASMGLACWTVTADWVPALSCTASGLKGLIAALISAVIANQGAFMISPTTTKVSAAKADGKAKRHSLG